jgi:hypothetical protein
MNFIVPALPITVLNYTCTAAVIHNLCKSNAKLLYISSGRNVTLYCIKKAGHNDDCIFFENLFSQNGSRSCINYIIQ